MTTPLRASSTNDIRIAGQKEDIFDDGALTQQQPQAPISAGMGKFTETYPASPAAEVDDEDSGRISRDPVAHAMVSSAKTDHRRDSLADIYLTGIMAC